MGQSNTLCIYSICRSQSHANNMLPGHLCKSLQQFCTNKSLLPFVFILASIHTQTHTLIIWSALSERQICPLISLRRASAMRNQRLEIGLTCIRPLPLLLCQPLSLPLYQISHISLQTLSSSPLFFYSLQISSFKLVFLIVPI